MKRITGLVLALALPVAAAAETVQSQTYEADLTRLAVTMQAKSGKAIPAQQVHVTMRRRDGQPIAQDALSGLVGVAEQMACGARPVMVSLILGTKAGAGVFQVLCGPGG